MLTVTKQYRTETAHRLRDYDGLCRHLHGHSYLWEVTATADGVDNRGILVDFKELKGAMVTVLEPFDHALLLRKDDPLIQLGNGIDDFSRVHLFEENPTAENLACIAANAINDELPDGVRVTEVKVWETSTSFATWRAEAAN
jgi:6-pyruvoyltetrahydropterin/6-carboxytetrahydropterin synthase